MNKTVKKAAIFVTAALLLHSTILTAQESLDFSSDESVSSFDDFGSFDSDTGNGDIPAVTFNGIAKTAFRDYLDPDDGDEFSILPSFTLDLGYSASATEIQAKLFVSKDAVKQYPADILKELTMRAYIGNFILEGGKMNVVWGKGDKLHVLDNFNANDYTDFIIPDYLDRRIAEPMIRGICNSESGIRAEFVYTPMMTADRYADSGRWLPATAASLTDTVQTVLGTQATYALATNNAGTLLTIMDKKDSIVPKPNSLEYGQVGARITASAGIFDWGVSYYYGHYKQPSADMNGYFAAKQAAKTAKQAAAQAILAEGNSATEAEEAAKSAFCKSYADSGDAALPVLDYDMLQVFGLEGAAVVGPLNMRAEAAYYLTKDTAGDNPWVHNNSVQWLFGFDIDIPVHNVNVNIQTIGKYILQNGTIEDGIYKADDVDYDEDGTYTNNKLVVNVSDTYLHEKLKLECNVLWSIERGDLLIMPKLSYTIADGMSIAASGLYITGDSNSEFAEWKDNSFAQLLFQYQF